MRVIDLTAARFGRLCVSQREQNTRHGKAQWMCHCDCGGMTVVSSANLRAGHTTSCGCFRLESIKKANSTHALTNTPLYKLLTHICDRCYNPKNQSYKDYGGRGIGVCSQWRGDKTRFINWALDAGWKKGLTIDRIDNDRGYSPSNCRFVTTTENNRNKRNNRVVNCGGKSMCVSEWAEHLGMNYSTLIWRLNNKPAEEALGYE